MIPVVFIHRGNQDYFKAVVKQSSARNPVMVIGDSDPGNCSFFNISNYYESATEFEKNYENLSTNGTNSELICFSRWFILKDFMERNDIPIIFHLDTDVLFFDNAEKEWEKFKQFDFTLSHHCCGNNSFFTLHGLKEFCDFTQFIYRNKSSYEYEKIASHYYIRQKHGLPGGVCDMTLLEFFSYKNCGKIGEMMHIINDSTYDHNINESDQGFRMSSKGIKEISFKNNIPFCFSDYLKKSIQFKALHFQGGAKRFLLEYLK